MIFGLCLAIAACKPKANQAKPNETCMNCLADMVYHSNFQQQRMQFSLRVDEESSDLVKMKLYHPSTQQTLGWIAYYPKQRKLVEVSSYLHPKPLEVNLTWLEKYERCRGILGDNQPKGAAQRMAINTIP